MLTAGEFIYLGMPHLGTFRADSRGTLKKLTVMRLMNFRLWNLRHFPQALNS
jgi:hypothetical protein